LTNAHVDYLRKNLDTTYDTHRLLKHDQQIFVDAARDCSFQDFIEVCAYWLVHVDPDGKEPKDQIERSALRIGVGRGGRGEIKATCDAITRQKLDTAVEHETAKLRKQDNAAGIERTDSQRRMAALTALVERGAQREDGTYPVPLANIVMSQAVYDWGLGVLNGTIDPADTVPVNAFDIDGRCELIDGTPIHPFLAIMAMGNHGLDCHGQPNLRRYVLDAKSRVLDMSVNARSAPEWQRTGTLIETRGRCSTHGCEAPHHWLVSDHVQPVAHSGKTEFHNIQPLCRPDNQAKAATPGLTAWRHRPHPARQRPRPRGAARPRPDPEAF
jgi:hypothetical protein